MADERAMAGSCCDHALDLSKNLGRLLQHDPPACLGGAVYWWRNLGAAGNPRTDSTRDSIDTLRHSHWSDVDGLTPHSLDRRPDRNTLSCVWFVGISGLLP